MRPRKKTYVWNINEEIKVYPCTDIKFLDLLEFVIPVIPPKKHRPESYYSEGNQDSPDR